MQTNVDTWSFSILFYQFNSLNRSYLYQIVFFFKECVCFSIFFVICGGFFFSVVSFSKLCETFSKVVVESMNVCIFVHSFIVIMRTFHIPGTVLRI